jgi:phosphoglycolate phosphatase
MTRIQGVLFDKDGTLIDFTGTWRGLVEDMIADYADSDEALAESLGLAVGYDRSTGLFLPGSPIVADTTAVVADLMAALLPGRSASDIEADANARAAALGGERGPMPVPGLRAALALLQNHNLHLGIATHDSERAARQHAKSLNIADLIKFYAGYDSGYGLKPGPGMPTAFCAAHGLMPERIIMVGDSLHDLEAGRSAGAAAVVGVLTGPATEAELAPHADIVLPSVADLPAYIFRQFPE